MIEHTCAVRTDELEGLLQAGRFLALPAEEVARYLGAAEVLRPEAIARDRSLVRFVTYTVAHYNYAWFTHRNAASRLRSLGIVGRIEAGADMPLFCDDSIDAHAARTLRESIALPDACDLRMAGLLRPPADQGESWVAQVYVARLRRPGASSRTPLISEIEFRGMGELEQARAQFDACSQLLIDKLFAL